MLNTLFLWSISRQWFQVFKLTELAIKMDKIENKEGNCNTAD